ncbi:unnamed protein product [Phyllotreta striolata]|uniref:Large ribosomal subunit protein mL44 n=1 Tax=Phyllotreta striolata TaxID=444603 RepID=A0A9N9XJZ6_PHYSR|nr:unnamed protein product [Phyllotreta striolata]
MLKQSLFYLGRTVLQRHNNLFRITETRNIKRWVAPTLKELYRRKERQGPEPERPRSTYLEWNYNAELYAFGKRLGEDFKVDLLRQALTQKEYSLVNSPDDDNATQIPHNYELIREGEDIINNYLKQELSKSYPEDIVNSVLEYLTTEKMLSHIGTHIGLKDIILTTEFPVDPSTISNTFKSVVSALKHSQDLPRAEQFVRDFVLSQISDKDVLEIWEPQEPYNYLTKLVQEKGLGPVEPRLCSQSASNTILRCFQVGLYSDKKLLGIGWGENVNIAKESAALDALQKLWNTNKVLRY